MKVKNAEIKVKNPKTFLTILTAFCTLMACSPKDSTPQDYWSLSEPQILIWDAAENARVSPLVQQLTDFDSSDIQTTLGYQSHILFSQLSSEVQFEIKTSCEEASSNKKDSLNTDDSSNKDVSSPMIFNKIKTLGSSKRIYFYDFLPDEILIDNNYKTQASDFVCDFDVTAKNEINSKHSFKIENLKINTFKGNFITINSIEGQTSNENQSIENKSNPTIRTIFVNPNVIQTDLPSLFYNDSKMSYSMSLNQPEFEIKNPSYIQCQGSHNKFNLLNEFGELRSLDDIFKLKATDNSTTFLKKCRILAMIDKKSSFKSSSLDQNSILNKNEVQTLDLSDQRLVWSEYFNVIFEEPKLELQTRMIDHTTNTYPFNQDTHLDPRIHLFDLDFTNKSNKKIKLHFPDRPSFEAKLTPIIIDMQKPNFKGHSHPSKLFEGQKKHYSNDVFMSKIHFIDGSAPVTEFELQAGESKKIEIHLDKNFRCNFPKTNHYYIHPFAEVGFKIEALPLNIHHDSFTMRLDYTNQGQLESYPESFNFENALKNIKNKVYKNLKNEKTVNINHLQIIPESEYVIATFLTRMFMDFQNPNYSQLFLESTYTQLLSYPARGIGLYSIPKEPDFEGSFCEQLY